MPHCRVGHCPGADLSSERKRTNIQLERTGPYVGADAGYASSRSATSYLASVPQSSPYLNVNQVLLFNQAAPDTVSARGVTGTLHAGWNWQLKPFAVGIELDAARFAHAQRAIPACCSRKVLSRRRSARGALMFAQLHTGASTDWLLTGRVRAGWVTAWDTFI